MEEENEVCQQITIMFQTVKNSSLFHPGFSCFHKIINGGKDNIWETEWEQTKCHNIMEKKKKNQTKP